MQVLEVSLLDFMKRNLVLSCSVIQQIWIGRMPMRLLKIYIRSSMSNINFVIEIPMDLHKRYIQWG